MEYCTNCGSELKGEKFCTNCGAKNECAVNQPISEVDNIGRIKENKGSFNIKKLIIIPVLVVAAFAIYFIFGSGQTCEDVASAVVDAEFGCTSRDVVAKYAKVLPENYFNYIVEEGKDWIWDDADGWIDYQYEENYSDNIDKYISKFGEDYKYSFKIVNEIEYDEEELSNYADECEEYDIVPKAAKDVTIKVRVTGNDTGNDYSIEVTMIKVGNSWYLLDI